MSLIQKGHEVFTGERHFKTILISSALELGWEGGEWSGASHWQMANYSKP